MFSLGDQRGKATAAAAATSLQSDEAALGAAGDADERRRFLEESEKANKKKTARDRKANRKAHLAKAETIEDDDDNQLEEDLKVKAKEEAEEGASCARMVSSFFNKRRRLLVLSILLLLILVLVAAIYCLPFVEVEPGTVQRLPQVAFNFHDGPLRPSDAAQFKAERLFHNQISGAESVALDSEGNMYMVIQGGFVLYAHLNASSPAKRPYYSADSQADATQDAQLATTPHLAPYNLVKIAELNGIRQLPYETNRRRGARLMDLSSSSSSLSWRRECQQDEELYGSQLTVGGQYQAPLPPAGANDIDSSNDWPARMKPFATRVPLSRCSTPLGVRLSPDESYLYVVDTTSGLFRVSLRVAERPQSTQRLVTRLLDFRAGRRNYVVPVVGQLEQQQQVVTTTQRPDDYSNGAPTAFMNVTLMAVDDLVIDYGAGTRGSDVIYLTLASQRWLAHQFLYDLLEGRPTGVVLRLDTGSGQLTALSPQRVAHVRMAGQLGDLEAPVGQPNIINHTEIYGIGAPHLDENDVFDDRPLHFPNGLELTDDRQALLICDTSNKRIIKHYIRGPRRGTSDLWAWTPNFPDNIRRGFDRHHETYWVVGCGQDMSNKLDLLAALRDWPMVRKYFLKNIYLFGWFLEFLGQHVLKSPALRDFGHSCKTGHLLLERYMCPGMMVLQYNSYGDIVRSIHSKEFPHDLAYYSQVNEIVDAKNEEHLLYLSSPMYNYVTKLTLPSIKSDTPPPSTP